MGQDDFERLISRYLDGTIDARELGEFEEYLASGEVPAQRFAEWCLMHRQVADILSEDRLHDLIDQMLVDRPGPPRTPQNRTEHPGLRQQLAPSKGWAWWSPRLVSATVGAAAMAVAATVGLLLWWPTTASDGTPSSVDAPASEVAVAVASLAQLIDATWNASDESLETGQLLKAGDRVKLASGRAKVIFDCGAEVVLEGPCDLELKSRMLAVLHAGRVTADVPRRAFGFGMLCPGVDLIDLGTSFGVNVGEGGTTELHVFDGEVLCSPNKLDATGTRQILHVHENQAKQFRPGQAHVDNVRIDQRQFESLHAVRRRRDATPNIAASNMLALWLAADGEVALDDDGRVISCHDILYGGNASAEDALQPDPSARPLLVSDAINGKAAIRFDGESDYLLTTPLETTDDQTVLFVCQFTPNATDDERVWGGQILNYDGPPSRYLSDTLEPGVLQIGEPLLATEFKPTFLTAQVFAGFVGETTVESGRVDAHPVGVRKPILVAYTYNYTQGQSELRIDGVLCGTSRAFAPQGITSRKIIGRHAWMQLYFHGDLAEMLIYNTALSPEQLAETSSYLAEKYSITLPDDSAL